MDKEIRNELDLFRDLITEYIILVEGDKEKYNDIIKLYNLLKNKLEENSQQRKAIDSLLSLID